MLKLLCQHDFIKTIHAPQKSITEVNRMYLAQAQESHTSLEGSSFHLSGELNRKGVKAFRQLLKSPVRDLVLNLRNVNKIDARGLAFLLKLQQKYTQAGLTLKLVELPVRIMMFMEFTRTMDNFAIATPQPAVKVAA